MGITKAVLHMKRRLSFLTILAAFALIVFVGCGNWIDRLLGIGDGYDPPPVTNVELLRNPEYMAINAMPEDTAKFFALGRFIRDYARKDCTGPDQCRSMPIGHKACGGSAGHVVYSTATTDSTTLAYLVKQYTDLNDVMIMKYGWISTCEGGPAPPELDCVDGSCADTSAADGYGVFNP
jgi:hypothetical protein